MFSGEICETLKNTYFKEHVQTSSVSFDPSVVDQVSTTETSETFTCSKSITETLEKGLKYVKS